MLTYIFVSLLSASYAADFTWQVTNKWSPTYEKKFGEFVKAMGNTNCRTLAECIKSPRSNPFYAARTPNMNIAVDCGRLPYALRIYFSWMESLPFGYVNATVAAQPRAEVSSDLRYTKFGNKPASRYRIEPGGNYNFLREFSKLMDSVFTAVYRMSYTEISDFYPPAIDPRHIAPGTVVYDPSGHVAIIYQVEKDGRIRLMDAHPDNSITRITYDKKFVRSRSAHGAGFKNWRPALNMQPTQSLPGFSLEQYGKSFSLNGENMNYYDYVRGKMAGGTLSFNPVNEQKSMMTELCANVHDRESAIETALASGVQNKSHPDRLPINIYGTSGEWEDFSSPSRDARLKVAFVELRQEIQRYIEMYKAGNPRIQYKPEASRYSGNCGAGDNTCLLVASLMTAYEDSLKDPACTFKYTNSGGAEKKLVLTDIYERLFALSFDPYHCVELRWGAQGDELKSCRDDRYKMQWYTAEQGLRNQTERTYEARMDADLRGAEKLGVAQPPDIDLWSYLKKTLTGGAAELPK